MKPTDDNLHPWIWFTDKILPPLFVALCLALSGGMWATYRSVESIGYTLENQQREIDALRARISHVESSLVTKAEMLETLKRVEQQLEIMMLRAGMNAKPRLTQ